jgi:hypothetical protein
MNMWYYVWSDPILGNKILYWHCSVYVLHHLCIPQESPDDGLSGPKYVVTWKIKSRVCVTVTLHFYLYTPGNIAPLGKSISPRSLKKLSMFWNLKVYYRFHKSQSLFHVLSLMIPVCTLEFCFFKIHFNIILQYTWSDNKVPGLVWKNK